MKIRNLAAGLAAALLISGCATSADMRNAPREAGISKDYEVQFQRAKRLALKSVQDNGLNVKRVQDLTDLYSIEFSKNVSIASWGEVGRVNVTSIPSGSRISVLSSKRGKFQLTGTDNGEFADMIFSDIDNALRAE